MFFPISTFPSALCSSRSNSVVYTSFSLWGTLAGDLRQKVRRVRSGHLYPNPLQEACHWLAESVRADHSSVRWPPTYRSAVSLSLPCHGLPRFQWLISASIFSGAAPWCYQDGILHCLRSPWALSTLLYFSLLKRPLNYPMCCAFFPVATLPNTLISVE